MPSEKQLQWHTERAATFNTHFSFWFGPFRPAVGLCHPSAVKLLLKTAEPKAMSGKGGYSLLLDWLGALYIQYDVLLSRKLELNQLPCI